jgi:glycosyltransferase involved in cell wall biosynthesis
MGHHSIVACSGDSFVVGEQFVTIEKSFSEYWSIDTEAQRETMKRHLLLSLQRATVGDIDVIHMHDAVMLEFIFKGIVKNPVPIPIVMTLHVPAEEEDSFKKWNQFLTSTSGVYFVPISEYQRKQHEGLVNLQRVIHHGIDVEDYPFREIQDRQDYFFSLGRITRDKGQDKAIETAKKTNSRLIVAGNIQNKEKDRKFFKEISCSIDWITDAGQFPGNDDYYAKVMKPILDSEKQIIYIGELNRDQKKQWYAHARATLFPIQWGEPFGLVLIESMACGTPVVALNRGSVPEIILHGKTGYVVDSMDEMTASANSTSEIDPHVCRKHVEDHFSIESMTRKYSEVYKQIKR